MHGRVQQGPTLGQTSFGTPPAPTEQWTEMAWYESFTPIKNPANDDIQWERHELARIDAPANRVWACIEGSSGAWYLIPGYHWVDCIYHVLTEEEWTKDNVEVLWADAPEPYGQDTLHCDLCGQHENAADLTADWNGETGCHRTCEESREENRLYDQMKDDRLTNV